MSNIYGMDWAHKDEKKWWCNGKTTSNKEPKLKKGDVIVTENVPDPQLKEMLAKGIKVLSCQTKLVKEWLERNNLEKNDENDAIALFKIYKDNPDVFWEREPRSDLYHSYEFFKEVQHLKVMLANRNWANKSETNEYTLEQIESLEEYHKKIVAKELKKYTIWNEYLKHIKGIGPSLAGGLISTIENIKKFDTISALWAYFGYHVIDGKAPKKQKGKESNWNQKARSMCYLIGEQFFRQRSPVFRELIDTEKERQLSRKYKKGELAKSYKGYSKDDIHLSKGHAQNRAFRKAVKIFLQTVWVKWRELDKLPLSEPYVVDKLQHKNIITPDIVLKRHGI